MQELLRAIEYMKAYGKALEDGVKKFADSLPIFVRQEINKKAKRKLDTTYEHYMSNVKTKMRNYILVVELNQDDWLTNAVESGVGAFEMKEGLLRSSKAKKSSKGYRYLRVPLNAKRNTPGGTEKSQDFQKRINEVLMKPKFGIAKLSRTMNGQVRETQKIENSDPSLQGLYRTRVHNTDDIGEVMFQRSRPDWQHVLFRTVSENPKSKAQWHHPGIKPAYILKSTESWLHDYAEEMLKGFIDAEVETLNQRFQDGT